MPYLFSDLFYLALILILIFIIIIRLSSKSIILTYPLVYFMPLFFLPLSTIFFYGSEFFIPIAFHILPFIFIFLVFLDSPLELDSKTLKILLFSIYLGLISLLYQNFIDPNLFGLIRHTTYNSELFGTSTFRPIGLFGSPQNAALFISIGLFLPFGSKFELIIRFTFILVVAILLKSTFLGVSIIIFFLRYFFKLTLTLGGFGIIFLGAYLFEDLSNTSFEFLNLSEGLYFYNRFYLSNFSDFTFLDYLVGKGGGTATQGMIDRGFVSINYFEAESYFFIMLHEYGFFYFVFIWIFFLRFLYKFYFSSIYNSRNYFYIILIFLISMLVTPSFSSLRVKVIAFFLVFCMYNIVNKKYNDPI